MSTLRTALAAATLGALGIPVMAAGAAGAPAQDDLTPFGFSVSPQSVRPGGAVELTVTDCTRFEATAESAVFDERIVLGTPGASQSTRTTVDVDARPGVRYDVLFTCGRETGTAILTIATGTPTPTPTVTATATPTVSATVKPTLGAQAGAGGSQAGDGGVPPTALLGGAALAVLAGACGTLLLRRRPRR